MKIGEICKYAPKSSIKAGQSVPDGKYMFFTSSAEENKRFNEYQQDGEGIIMGTGGNATLHYYNGKYAVSTDCVVLIANQNIKCKYLYYFFKSNMPLLEAGFKGAGLRHTNKNYISNLEFGEIPPLEIQNAVIKLLDLVESIIQKRQQQLIELDFACKARFVEMFVDADSAKEWPITTIKDVSLEMRTGPFGSSLHHDEFVDEGVFVLGIDNAVENKFSYNRMRFITEAKYQQLKRYTVKPGDVIITIMGTLGRTAVIPENMPKAINTKHLACITLDKERMNPYFLAFAFHAHPSIQVQLRTQSKGSIMDGLNLTIIKKLKVALPPIDLQEKFVAYSAQIDKTKAVVQKALDEAQLLFDSLMQQYFG